MTTANKITIVRILMIPVFVTLAIYYGQSIQRGEPLAWQRFAAIIVFLLAAASVSGPHHPARRRPRGRLGYSSFTQRQSPPETKLDWQGRDRLPNVRHRVGDVATALSSPALCRHGRRIFHVGLRHHLRDGWRAPTASRRPR